MSSAPNRKPLQQCGQAARSARGADGSSEARTGLERVWILCEPSSSSYKITTRGEWMPILLNGERL
jgi:hypothetical protein